MKIVLDTNVLVAGLLSPFGSCGDIVRMVSSGNLTLCIDARVLSEYHEVLERPKLVSTTTRLRPSSTILNVIVGSYRLPRFPFPYPTSTTSRFWRSLFLVGPSTW